MKTNDELAYLVVAAVLWGKEQDYTRTEVTAIQQAHINRYYKDSLKVAEGVLDEIHPPEGKRPTVVCLCGSTRFSEAFQKANLEETLAGRIVLTIGCDTKADGDLFGSMDPEELADLKGRLDELHLRKIDRADEILVLNAGGYIGQSTANELAYGRAQGKRVRFLEPPAGQPEPTPFDDLEPERQWDLKKEEERWERGDI